MNATIKIKDKKIGKGHPALIVAEISANHGQNFNRAVKMIKKAKECGADAVKFQTYTPDTLTINANNRYFRIEHPKWGGQTLYQLYKKAYTPWKWFRRLKNICDDLGIIFFSTAFDKTAVDFLEGLKVPIHKTSSFELVDLQLIEYIAQTKKPIIISTGMGSFSEIAEAVKAAKKAGAKEIILLKCVSSYPARVEEMNLKTIPDMAERFRCLIGLSDHTLGKAVSIAAVSLETAIIEKHFTLSRKIKTPDGFFSIEPQELRDLVENIRAAERALGGVRYGAAGGEKKSRIFRRSLFAVKNIKEGERFDMENIRSIRPGYGLAPKYLREVNGKKARRAIKKGVPLRWSLID